MPVASFNHSGPGASQTLATFKAWAEGIQDAMLAVGFTLTADTGQINFASIVSLPTADTLAGYQIFEFNDALSGVAPIFVKVKYYVGQSSTAEPGFQLAKGTDGAGNLVDTIGTECSVYNGGTTGISSANSYFSAGEGYFVIWLFNDMTVNEAQGLLLVFQRAIDLDGGYRSDGFYFGRSRYGSTPGTLSAGAFHMGYNYATLGSIDSGALPIQLPAHLGTNALGLGSTPMFFIPLILAPGIDPWQPTVIAGIPPADNPNTDFDADVWEVTRTYYAPPFNSSFGINIIPVMYYNSNTVSSLPAQAGSGSIAFLWEA